MQTYIAQRLAVALLTLIGMSMVIFVLLRLAPGDIVDVLFSAAGYVNPTWDCGTCASRSATCFPTRSDPSYAPKAPHLVLFPGLAISLAVFGSNLFGAVLRDTLDPRLRGA